MEERSLAWPLSHTHGCSYARRRPLSAMRLEDGDILVVQRVLGEAEKQGLRFPSAPQFFEYVLQVRYCDAQAVLAVVLATAALAECCSGRAAALESTVFLRTPVVTPACCCCCCCCCCCSLGLSCRARIKCLSLRFWRPDRGSESDLI